MINELKAEFQPILAEFLQSNPISLVVSNKITVSEYRAILREVFHHTRENPQLQALATVYFRGRQRDMVSSFFKHAASEIGHDQLALNDYITLDGKNSDIIPYENPLPATSALLSYGFYQIYNLNPLGYLGYLFFLEFMPTTAGGSMIKHLGECGIPDTAMTFLKDHTTIDQGHNRLMEKYAGHLLNSEVDFDCVVNAMRTTGFLYASMMESAIKDATMPTVRGWNWEELNADGVDPSQLKQQVA